MSGVLSGSTACSKRADAADLGRHAGGDHHAARLAGGDQGARVRHAVARAELGTPRARRFLLGRRHRLAGEQRLVEQQAARVAAAHVGRHAVAGLEQHHVAGTRLATGTLRRAPSRSTAACGAIRRRIASSAFLRLALLDEADQRVEQHHGNDHRSVDRVAEDRRRERRGEQEIDAARC
jgi:hypothetical protein